MRKEKLRKFEFVAIGLVVSMMFVCVFSARAFASFAGDIYIRADGSIDPLNAPIATSDNITYVLTADVFGTLTIQRDNIVFDGVGHTFTGSGSGYGITLAGRSNVTVENTACESFSYGIYLDASSGCTLQNNNFTANYYYGIWLYYSSGNTLSDKTHLETAIMASISIFPLTTLCRTTTQPETQRTVSISIIPVATTLCRATT